MNNEDIKELEELEKVVVEEESQEEQNEMPTENEVQEEINEEQVVEEEAQETMTEENSHDKEVEENVEEQETEVEKTEDVEAKEQTQPSNEYFQMLLKLQAEFDNYRKRTEMEMSKVYKNGFVDAIIEFLPALDSFKMATDMITDKNTLMGIQFIEKGILNTLEKMGVKVIDATGKFDPNFHQAIETDSTADVEEGHIVKECYKGFIMGDKVLRYSQVIVKK